MAGLSIQMKSKSIIQCKESGNAGVLESRSRVVFVDKVATKIAVLCARNEEVKPFS